MTSQELIQGTSLQSAAAYPKDRQQEERDALPGSVPGSVGFIPGLRNFGSRPGPVSFCALGNILDVFVSAWKCRRPQLGLSPDGKSLLLPRSQSCQGTLVIFIHDTEK